MSFKNIALIDFSEDEPKRSFAEALQELDRVIQAGPIRVQPIIDGKTLSSKNEERREDPSASHITVGNIGYASIEQAEAAVESIKSGFKIWSRYDCTKRSEIIARAGQIMLERRFALSALIIREAGKTWKEADADVVEAIDFCNYYADQALQMAKPEKTDNILGEDNFYFYKPKGLALVIPPWNFPLAIACGMLTAALVCGNTAILKPAEQSSVIADALVKILYEAGVPHNALAFLPGKGEEIGRHLVAHPDIHIIAFTGSRNVGLEIVQKAAIVHPGQQHIKKVIAELGGKNAVIVDEDADLDQALKGILTSAFSYAGQKCSACSRVLVVGDNYAQFCERLKNAVESLIIGKASDPESFLGPVIDAEAAERIKRTIQMAINSGAKMLAQAKTPASLQGHFIPPTVFVDVDFKSDIWREEIFGPVLAVASVQTFEQAVECALDSDYALTGGVFSRSPANIEFAKQNFLVGNLYINRGCTGAVVNRQPFGGFKLSGIGSKAGGPDYLLQFCDPRCVTENTVRRGFTPDLL